MDPQVNQGDGQGNQIPSPNTQPPQNVVSPSQPVQQFQPSDPYANPNPTVTSPNVVVGQSAPMSGSDPTVGYQAPNAFVPMSEKPKKSWLKRILRAFLVLIVLGVLAGAGIIFAPKVANKISATLHASKQSSALNELKTKAASITADQVAKLNGADAFFAVFANAAQQKTVTTTSSYYFSNMPNDYSQDGDLRRVSFDYPSKRFSYEANTADIAGGTGVDETRCIGTQQYDYLSSFSDQGWTSTADGTDCTLSSLQLSGLNDGVNAGGLTSSQAQTFVQQLRNKAGLITVQTPKLVTQGGKPYVRFDVTLHPIHTPGYGYVGMQYLMWAFKDTGLDPATLPYTYLGAVIDGLHMAYYVDPTTQLPVYAQIRTTDKLNDQGKPEAAADQTYDYVHVEYIFGGSVPTLNLNGYTPITPLTWPTDKSV